MNITTNEIKIGLEKVALSIRQLIADTKERNSDELSVLLSAHAWHTEAHVLYALECISHQFEQSLWLDDLPKSSKFQTNIAFLFRGQASLEGFGLLTQALFSGCHCQINVLQNECSLFSSLLERFYHVFPELEMQVQITRGAFQRFDGLIAIGEPVKPLMAAYLNDYPVLNQTAKHKTASLKGCETSEELDLLARDICMHFGRAMGSIQHLMVPSAYDFSLLNAALNHYSGHRNHARYFNHYEYRKAAMLINNISHIDLGHLLLTDDLSQEGYVSALVYTVYNPGDEQIFADKKFVEVSEFGKASSDYFEDSTLLHEFLKKVQRAAV